MLAIPSEKARQPPPPPPPPPALAAAEEEEEVEVEEGTPSANGYTQDFNFWASLASAWIKLGFRHNHPRIDCG